MRASQPCELCGCTEINLHDGFYFCTECGTQDTNLQETVVEVIAVGGENDGILHGIKKKIRNIVEEETQMSDAWYKWHAFNFLLKGTADELMEYGANLSFKTKLMWVWARYMKKYIKRDEMGLNKNPHETAAPESDDDIDSDVDEPPQDLLTAWDMSRDKKVKSFSFTLLVTIIFIALNLDKSPITLTYLVKLFRDGLLSVPYRIQNIVPKEMKPEKLAKNIRKGLAKFKSEIIRTIAMTLFKRLDLGNPILPDLRLIIDNHLKELCLPNDLKPLVLSLMHYKPCGFLDVNSKDKVIHKFPAYELHMMIYIIWAMKLCLGLDCEYEVKLSKAAEAINEKEERPKSFCINGESSPTNRLFSCREWITSYQFRQTLLRHYCYRYVNKTSWDTDDYIALEHHMDLLEYNNKKELKDEMTHDLLTRLKGGGIESFVIPKSEFKPTLTPFHCYTQVLAKHLQDSELKVKLTEDFTQYSLKYAIDKRNLVNPNSRKQKNLVRGITVNNKEITNKKYDFKRENVYGTKMVYVRNCENHNWLTTKRPTLKHMVKVDRLRASDEDDNQQPNNIDVEKLTDNPETETIEKQIQDEVESKTRSISEISLSNNSIFFENTNILESNVNEKCKLSKISESNASNSKFPDEVSEHSFTNSTLSSRIQYLDETKVFESTKLDETEKSKIKEIHNKITNPNEIQEEIEGENIFDDDFKPEIKKELEENEHCQMDCENAYNVTDNFNNISIGNNDTGARSNDSHSVISMDSVVFNEASFDRAKAIKEIIIYTCQKHKLPIPPEYKSADEIHTKRRREMGVFTKNTNFERIRIIRKNNKQYDPKRNKKIEMERRLMWKSYVSAYHAAVENDVLNQIAQNVNTAVQNANSAQENEAPPFDTAEEATADHNMDIDMECTNVINNDNEELSETMNKNKDDSDEERLFSEESEGETYAKELLPAKNPDFDEEMYDTSQLYVKAATTDDPGEMELDPQLSSIINKKIIKDSLDPLLLTWTEERKKIPRPDSEDEMPLSVIQELIKLTSKLSEQESEWLEQFLDEPVKDFKYWIKFYTFIAPHTTEGRMFEKEIMNELPSSFAFLLRQCAYILGVSEGHLYKNLQRYETTALEKSKIKLNAK